MDTSEKAELTASIRHFGRFSKQGIPIYRIPQTPVALLRYEDMRLQLKLHSAEITCQLVNL